MRDEVRLSDGEILALGDAIAETAAMLDAAMHRFLSQLREFDRIRGWERSGALTAAHWLSWRVGLDLGAARERVRVARKIAELPLIDRALAEGSISYSKVRAMTRVATATNEADLLTMARTMTGTQLERICRLTRQVTSLDGKDARDVEDRERYAVSRRRDDGMVSIKIVLHPDEAARVMKAFEVASGAGNLADGAVALAESALAGRELAASDEPAERRSVRPPVEVVVHISADSLTGETYLGDGVSAEVARRLLCDCGVVPVLEDGSGKTIDVGRKTRTIPAALQRALEWRDRGCRFPGCTNRRFVDAHHLINWIHGGETSLDNTLLVCRRHHRYLHEFGYDATKEGGEIIFRDPAGRIVPSQGERPPVVGALTLMHQHLTRTGIAISPETNTPRWDGERIDHDLCVAALTRSESRPASH